MFGKASVRGLVAATVTAFAVVAQAVTIETVSVGNPGNANDAPGFGAIGCGAVDYVYHIGKYEVTNAQYCEFLNAKATTDTYGLYNTSMSSSPCGGITRSGDTGSYSYAVKSGYENMPVVFVCWYDSVRFANWLSNGQTETGGYTITGGGPNSGNVSIPDTAQRATWAAGSTVYWLLPSPNEWYKAAYHQPAAQGGDTDDYWAYPTRTNTAPHSDQPPGSDSPIQANTANFLKDDDVANGYDDGYAVTGSSSYVASQNYLTDVGAYTLSNSFYGTFDQGGNAWEWTSGSDGSARLLRGGNWHNTYGIVARGTDYFYPPTWEGDYVGFRVASVPEPGSIVFLFAAAASLCAYAWRRRRQAA